MKTPSPAGDRARFYAPVRHYHRSGAKSQTGWDEWVDGPSRRKRNPSKVFKMIIAVTVVLLVMAGIAALLVWKV